MKDFLNAQSFQTYNVRTQDINKIIPEGKRCGIYILHMKDNTFYVGQAKDVVKRYAQHCRTYKDIQWLSFKRVPQKSLDTIEKQMIHTLESKGWRLLNVVHANITYRQSTEFDLLMPPEEQQRWMTDMKYTYHGSDRSAQELKQQQQKFPRRFAELCQYEDHQEVIRVLKQYVQTCLPAFRATQFEYWSISCLPGTFNYARYATVNIARMETFVVGKGDWCFINIAESPLKKAYPNIADFVEQYPPDTIELRFAHYEDAGFDQVNILMDTQRAPKILKDPAIIAAARTLNLQLMRKRKVFYARMHCVDLAQELVR